MATFWADFFLSTLFLPLSSESFVSHGEVTEQLCFVLGLVKLKVLVVLLLGWVK